LLPTLTGDPIRVAVRRTLGPHWAATSIPRRRILLDREVLAQPGEFERILVHELFHFVWVRLGNPVRREWKELLAHEIAARARGELGWSAEWRKKALGTSVKNSRACLTKTRTRAWRRYVCESFCDTAAWLYAGLGRHDEFTLAERFRRHRARWFERNLGPGPVRI